MTSRTVAFDLDQTLVDSRHRIVESFRSAFRAMQHADVPPEAFEPWFGYPLEEILRRVAPGATMAEFEPRYRHAYDVERAVQADPMPGARSCLERLRADGWRTIVVSAKATHAVGATLEEAGLEDVVDGYHGDHFGEQKAIVLREEDVAYYVGDHVADMHAASLAGVPGVAVVSGSHDTRALREAGAAAVVASIDRVPEAVRELTEGEDRD